MSKVSAYAQRMEHLHLHYADHIWERTANGGHIVETYPEPFGAPGPIEHRHFRPDGSPIDLVRCSCFVEPPKGGHLDPRIAAAEALAAEFDTDVSEWLV